MNKMRRREIRRIIEELQKILIEIKIGSRDVVSQINDLEDDIRCVYEDEYDYMENIPENLQNGYRYYKAEEACDVLDNAADALASINSDDDIDFIYKHIDSVISGLQQAL